MGGDRAGVVVGVDGSESARDAVRWAAAEAARRHRGLRVLCAGAGATPRMLREAEALARRAVADVTVEVVCGDPTRVLVDASQRAQLLVVGNRGLGALVGVAVPSVSAAVSVRSHCPVVVVRGPDREPRPDDPVLLGVEGTPAGEAAIGFAFAAADARGAPLVALHVWSDPFDDPEWSSPYEEESTEEQEREVLAERLAGWQRDFPSVAVTRLVAPDRPAHALVARSVQARLLVVGGRGHRHGVHRPGSVARAVLHEAHCPVAVVRADVGAGRRSEGADGPWAGCRPARATE